MLEIKNLHASIKNKEILKGVNLKINTNEVHVIMGPNGTGKSTLSNILAGKDDYEVTKGEIIFDGKNLLELSANERALLGVFLSFQYPVEIPGVSNINFFKSIVNASRKAKGLDDVDAMPFLKEIREKAAYLNIDEQLLYRSVNEGFSGGEKKRNEILQMLLLEPKLGILDEIDSGLDIDALKVISEGVNSLRKDSSFLIITHYKRLLEYITPDYIHVLANGKIVKSGGIELADELESKGYSWLESA
tara:strand:+ start:7814 stop:8554 length:741 start_codon:yes stop_codon:yes gene_type:complete